MADARHTIREVAALLRIAHHVPGRVRLKLDAAPGAGLGQGLAEARRFVQAASTTAGIRSVDLNPLARSCVVEYDPQVIAPSAWSDLVGGVRSDGADALAGALAAACG